MGSEQFCTLCCSGTRYGKGKLALATEIEPIKQLTVSESENRLDKGLQTM